MTGLETDVRPPAVAGRFYPGERNRLATEVSALLESDAQQRVRAEPALALLAPHAGYIYSGRIAGETYAAVQVPRRVVVLCPNHTGLGTRASIWHSGEWQLPLGSVPVDRELAELVLRHAEVRPDHAAHLREHAIEVQLPFLLVKQPELSFVPICLSGLSAPQCRDLGRALAAARRELGEHVLFVASSDMSHYIHAARAKQLDQLALDRVLALDPEGLYETVHTHGISMCGYVPMVVALHAALALGANRARLVRYGNSGDRSGDYERVVGYAGAIIA